MKTKELGPLLELARKDNMVGKAARDEVQRIVNTLAAELLRCRELLELAVICEDDYLTTSGAMPQEWYEHAKKYLSETEG